MNYVAGINNDFVAQGTRQAVRSAFVNMHSSVICGHLSLGCTITVHAAYRILCG